MCGICCMIFGSNCDNTLQENWDALLCHRGPDVSTTHNTVLVRDISAVFAGYTLHFRGQLTRQPLQDECGNLLLWNGEIFDGIDVHSEENDGEVLFNQLRKQGSDIVQIVAKIQGPWSVIYWQKDEQKLWFGRDVFGRRSMLWQYTEGRLALSSVKCAGQQAWQELPAFGLYCIQFGHSTNLIDSVVLYPWLNTYSPQGTIIKLNPEKCITPTPEEPTLWRFFNNRLKEAVQTEEGLRLFETRVDIAPIGIQPQFVPFNTSIPCEDIQQQCRKDGITQVVSIEQLQLFAFPEQFQLADRLLEILGQAVKVRVESQSVFCDSCMKDKLKSSATCTSNVTGSAPSMEESCPGVSLSSSPNVNPRALLSSNGSGCGHAPVALLFSGGIDSLVLAALADKFVPIEEPIDLLNVAFEQKIQDASSDPFAVPDRITGLLGLSQLNPERQWNFVEINVTMSELQEARSERVSDLVYPLCTVLDDSIGCAIWFAARGKGIIKKTEGTVHYSSTARVVLVGMGADEQLIGYARHRSKFSSEGWSGLMTEIQMEIERISARNLGRDDRVISDNGRESRFPFLDENVVSFLNQTPVWLKANLCLPRGIGEKFLLRLLATKLGLEQSALLPKRAIQFGSRIAKMENRKEKASDTCSRLQAK